MKDTIGFRQKLCMTSFEAFELEITVKYFSVYTWIENDIFMHSLTSWRMPCWLVLLTEHKVIHCYALNAVYRCLVAWQWYPFADSLQHTVDASQFPTLVRQFTECSACTVLLCQIEVESWVQGIDSSWDEAERRRLRNSDSAGWWSSSARYDSARPCRHL